MLILGAVVVITLGALLYGFRGKFLPKPVGEAVLLIPPPRIVLPAANEGSLYERPDFQALRRFGDVPVRPHGTWGSPEPFVSQNVGQQ